MRYLLIIVFSALFWACGSKEIAPDGQQSLMEASKQELATALEERDQLLALVKDITVSMDRIKHIENVLTVSGVSPNENSAQRQRMLSDIAAIQQELKQRRDKLAEMEKRFSESSLYSEQLGATLEALRHQVDNQYDEIEGLRDQLTSAHQQIITLNTTVDSLNTAVDSVNQDLDAALAASYRLANELNTCYYVVAPKAQLQDHHIIETRFLRKSRLLKGDFDQGFFVIADKRNLTSIDLNSPKVKLYTNHPEDSYVITETDSTKTLTILDYEKFWSITNYLVIQID